MIKHASKRSRDRDGRHHRDSDRHQGRSGNTTADWTIDLPHRAVTTARDLSRGKAREIGSIVRVPMRKSKPRRRGKRGKRVEERGEKRSKLGEENKKGKRERRRFGDKAKEDDEIELSNGANFGDPVHNGAAQASLQKTGHPPSYQVQMALHLLGKSGANFSLDALAKAKKALQMQKELAEKMRKIPALNKGPSSSPVVTTGTVQGRASSVTTAISSGPASSSAPPTTVASSKPPTTGIAAVPGLASIPNLEAVKRAQELAAKMGFRQDPQFGPLINLFPGQVQVDVSVAQKPTKASVLRVDALGREIDEHGNIISVIKPSNLSTLKVNINKQKKDAFQILQPELEVDLESNPHFDARMGINKDKLLRPKRMSFQFVEEGKWSKDAEVIKLKSQFGEAKAKELKAKQAQLAKAKADINPNLIEVSERIITKEKPKDPIPEIEWWDLPLLVSGSYDDIVDGVLSED
ncbi:hypothetical protein V6N13_062688 [Hibiscus sabdariffa]|uniref:Pre-mRNA-splicing factor 3 domain-containing protein n=1 Tax=Hibiscus sabdariffa TaxID=183260 RepID=A0ABR2A3G7_9ROSI